MKKKRLLSILSLLLTISFSQPAQAIKITFGTKCHPDGNGACVGDRGICLIIEIKKNQALARYADPSGFLGDDMAYGEMTMTTHGVIRLDVLSQNSDVLLEEHFTIEEPVVLSEELSRDFGFREVTLLPGVYTVDYGAFRYGSVQLPVSVR
jgi:hypothetical protein